MSATETATIVIGEVELKDCQLLNWTRDIYETSPDGVWVSYEPMQTGTVQFDTPDARAALPLLKTAEILDISVRGADLGNVPLPVVRGFVKAVEADRRVTIRLLGRRR